MSKKTSEVREIIKEANQLETEMVPPAPASLPPLPIPDIRIKSALIFLIVFYLSATALRFFVLEGPSFLASLKQISKPEFQIPPSPTILFGYFIYMCLACQFFPIP